MRARDFCYWMQGFLELQKAEGEGPIVITPAQAKCIEVHLSLVFKHEIDPEMGGPTHQAELNELHDALSVGNVKPGGLLRC